MFRILLVSFICFSSLLAHKINLFAYDEEGVLYIKSYFSKSSPCQECVVKLLDKDEKLITTLMSDAEGKTAIKLPKEVVFIVVEAGMGHQERITYHATSAHEKTTKEPSLALDFGKIILALVIIAFFFGGMYWLKKHKQKAL